MDGFSSSIVTHFLPGWRTSVKMVSSRPPSWKRNLSEEESHYVCQTDATTYKELLDEMRTAPSFEALSYVRLQKRAGKLWTAVKEYRRGQKLARTPAPTAAQRLTQEPVGGATAADGCPLCRKPSDPAAGEDGYCSYSCASGGGK